jgi:hypothetical protein
MQPPDHVTELLGVRLLLQSLLHCPQLLPPWFLVINKAWPSFSAAAFKLLRSYDFAHTGDNGFIKCDVVDL